MMRMMIWDEQSFSLRSESILFIEQTQKPVNSELICMHLHKEDMPKMGMSVFSQPIVGRWTPTLQDNMDIP